MNTKSEDYPDNLLKKMGVRIELNSDMQKGLDHAISTLLEREKLILKERFQNRKTFKECETIFNLTAGRIRQIVDKITRKLRHPARLNYITYGFDGYQQMLSAQNNEKAFRLGAMHKMEQLDIQGIHYLDLSVRSYNCLTRFGIKTIGQLITLVEPEGWYSKVKNLGINSAQEITDKLFALSLLPEEKRINQKAMKQVN